MVSGQGQGQGQGQWSGSGLEGLSTRCARRRGSSLRLQSRALLLYSEGSHGECGYSEGSHGESRQLPNFLTTTRLLLSRALDNLLRYYYRTNLVALLLLRLAPNLPTYLLTNNLLTYSHTNIPTS